MISISSWNADEIFIGNMSTWSILSTRLCNGFCLSFNDTGCSKEEEGIVYTHQKMKVSVWNERDDEAVEDLGKGGPDHECVRNLVATHQ